MARSAGRYSQFYVAVTSGAAASPLSYAGSFDVNLATDKLEVTAFGDTTKQYVSGLPDGQFSVSGFASDTATTGLVAAALDGLARNFYIYPFNSTSIYVFGTAFFDWQFSSEVNGTVNFSSSAAPATAIGRVGF
jgi:hypothetical protein